MSRKIRRTGCGSRRSTPSDGCFDEPFPLPDISRVFPTYRFHPHNSVLGMLAFTGVLGFTGLWLYLVVTVFLAARSYHRLRDPELRASALVCITLVATYANQVFGDMGSISWIATILVAATVTYAGKLAVWARAWPAPQRAALRRAVRKQKPIKILLPGIAAGGWAAAQANPPQTALAGRSDR